MAAAREVAAAPHTHTHAEWGEAAAARTKAERAELCRGAGRGVTERWMVWRGAQESCMRGGWAGGGWMMSAAAREVWPWRSRAGGGVGGRGRRGGVVTSKWSSGGRVDGSACTSDGAAAGRRRKGTSDDL